jgi:hypothetical protein
MWPDILLELKIINNLNVYKILKFIVSYIYKKYDFIFAQSKTFQTELLKYNNNVDFIPSWAEDLKFEISKKNEKVLNKIAKYQKNTIFNIVFTGNVGTAQNFLNVIKCAELLKSDKNIQWIIVGSGRELDKIKEICLEKNINNFKFEGQQDSELIKYYHDIANVLFLSLVSGSMISGTIPGKFQTYLSSNKYILGFIDGEVKRIIDESGVGSCIPPDQPELLQKQIIFLKNNRHLLKSIEQQKLGSKYLFNNYNKDIILRKIISKFNFIYNNYEKIKLIKNTESIPFEQNFSLSGLNLAFLGFLGKKIKLEKHIYLWPDGVFHKRFYRFKFNKIPGKKLLTNIKLPIFIKNIYVLGNLSLKGNEYLKNKFNKNIVHIALPYGDISEIYNKCPKIFSNQDLIIITLPTPMQEQLSSFIANNSKFYKILCIGGALSMVCGDEVAIPKILDKLGLEFLWRLRTDTFRRSKRLFITFFFYLFNEITGRYSFIRNETIEKKI